MNRGVILCAIVGTLAPLAAARPLYSKDLNLNGDNGAFAYSGQQIADDFQLSADASVSRATWYGNFFFGGNPFSTGDQLVFALRFYAGTDSPVGAAFSAQEVVATVTETGLSQEGDSIYLFTANLSPVALSGGVKYFLNVEEIDPNTPKPSFRWNNGSNGIDDDLMYYSQDGAVTWNGSGDPRGGCAFTLDVPAPSTALIGAAGLLAAGRRRR